MNFQESLFNYDCANVRIVFDLQDLQFGLGIYCCIKIIVLDIWELYSTYSPFMRMYIQKVLIILFCQERENAQSLYSMSMAELTIAQIQRHFLFDLISVHLLTIRQDKKVYFQFLKYEVVFQFFIPQPNRSVVFQQLLFSYFTGGLLSYGNPVNPVTYMLTFVFGLQVL